VETRSSSQWGLCGGVVEPWQSYCSMVCYTGHGGSEMASPPLSAAGDQPGNRFGRPAATQVLIDGPCATSVATGSPRPWTVAQRQPNSIVPSRRGAPPGNPLRRSTGAACLRGIQTEDRASRLSLREACQAGRPASVCRTHDPLTPTPRKTDRRSLAEWLPGGRRSRVGTVEEAQAGGDELRNTRGLTGREVDAPGHPSVWAGPVFLHGVGSLAGHARRRCWPWRPGTAARTPQALPATISVDLSRRGPRGTRRPGSRNMDERAVPVRPQHAAVRRQQVALLQRPGEPQVRGRS